MGNDLNSNQARYTALAAFAATIACGGVSEVFWSIPELDRAQSYILAFEEGRGWRAIAGDRDSAVRVLHAPEDAQLYLLAFDAALRELSLSPGELDTTILGARGDCALAHPAAVVWRFSGAPPEDAWTPSQIPAALRAFLAPGPECVPCASFEENRDVLAEKVVSASWLASGGALLVLADHSLVWATPGESTPVGRCGHEAFSIQAVEGNEVWLAASSGIGRARIDESARQCIDGEWFPQPPGRGRVVAFGAASLAWPVWVLTSSGSLQRVDAGEFTEVGSIDMSRMRSANYHVVPHGEGVLVSIGSLEVHRYEQGRFSTDVIPPAAATSAEVTSLASIPPRALFGTNSGHLYARDADPWHIIYSTPGDGDIYSIAPFRGGALLVTKLGIVELPDQDPACPPLELLGYGGKDRAMIARDDLVLLPQLVGTVPMTDERPIVWLRRRG